MDTVDDDARLADVLHFQEYWCRAFGSPFYAALLAHAVHDCRQHGAVAALLAGHADDPPGSALALRLLGAMHRLVLAGDAPTLARHYPSTQGDGDADRAWTLWLDYFRSHQEQLRAGLCHPVQTNEVGRAAPLAAGCLTVARATGLPLRLREIGASAGLNLRLDRYRYETASGTWGPADAAIRFTQSFQSGRPPFATDATVVDRRGCDAAPLDPTAAADQLWLRAFVWPEDHARRARLDAALGIAATLPVTVDRAAAGDWVPQHCRPVAGGATIVFHSIVQQYIPPEQFERIRATLHGFGREATATAPLAWLRLEPGPAHADVHCTVWPGGEEWHLANCGPHGQNVEWLAD